MMNCTYFDRYQHEIVCQRLSRNSHRKAYGGKASGRRTFSAMALLNSLTGGDCCGDIAQKHPQYQE